MEIIIPIAKVDEEKRLVIGRAAQEVADRAGEIMDYETAKPAFMDWSKSFEEATAGLSKGNLRVMHGKQVAGKLIDIQFDDHNKAIDVITKVVDDNEWKKVLEGCYTGFSVGGSYAKRWEDGGLKRYTPKVAELSLVDRPCIPSAKFFELVKMDGSTEMVPFQEPDENALAKRIAESVRDLVVSTIAAQHRPGGTLKQEDFAEVVLPPKSEPLSFSDLMKAEPVAQTFSEVMEKGEEIKFTYRKATDKHRKRSTMYGAAAGAVIGGLTRSKLGLAIGAVAGAGVGYATGGKKLTAKVNGGDATYTGSPRLRALKEKADALLVDQASGSKKNSAGKDGRAGRDGDGDGVMNEAEKFDGPISFNEALEKGILDFAGKVGAKAGSKIGRAIGRRSQSYKTAKSRYDASIQEGGEALFNERVAERTGANALQRASLRGRTNYIFKHKSIPQRDAMDAAQRRPGIKGARIGRKAGKAAVVAAAGAAAAGVAYSAGQNRRRGRDGDGDGILNEGKVRKADLTIWQRNVLTLVK